MTAPGGRDLPRRRLLAGAASGCLGAAAPATAQGPDPPTDARLGVYRGAGCDGRPRIAAFGRWLGRMPGWAIDFLMPAEKDASWRQIRYLCNWAARCWRGTPYRMAFAMPMLPPDKSLTLAQGAEGACDAEILHIARTLAAQGLGGSVIRLGWEFNGPWSPWDASRDPAAFIAYWRRIVGLMRGVPGTAFRFDWNPVLGRVSIAPDRAYPGDDVVDLIGLDVYNQSWARPRPDAPGRWRELRRQPYGLDWHRDFAAAHRKPRSFPEWGTGRRPDGSGGGDDPLFISNMAAWLAPEDVAYHGYWDFPAPDYHALISSGGEFPRAAAMLRHHFGGAPPPPAADAR